MSTSEVDNENTVRSPIKVFLGGEDSQYDDILPSNSGYYDLALISVRDSFVDTRASSGRQRLSTTYEADEYVTELMCEDSDNGGNDGPDGAKKKRKKKRKKSSPKKEKTWIEPSEEKTALINRNRVKLAMLKAMKQHNNRQEERRRRTLLNMDPTDEPNPTIGQDTKEEIVEPIVASDNEAIYCMPSVARVKLSKRQHKGNVLSRSLPTLAISTTPQGPPAPKSARTISDPMRVKRLATHFSDKFDRKPVLPQYCTDYPLLPIDNIEKLQCIRNSFATLSKFTERIRFCVTAEVGKDWKSETNAPNEAFVHRRWNLVDRKPHDYKLDIRKLHSRMSEKQLTHKDLSIHQFGEFSKKFSLGFICMVVDVHMQILGTFDCSMGKFIPGLQLSPSFLTRKIAKSKLDYSRATLMEIEFSRLPSETFAVVPLLIDESYVHPAHKSNLPVSNPDVVDSTAVPLRCDIFMMTADPEQGQRVAPEVQSDMTKEEAEKFLPQDFIMAQCDGVEELWYKIALKRKAEEKLMVQRVLRLINRRLKHRKAVTEDSFLTKEQITAPAEARAAVSTSGWNAFEWNVDSHDKFWSHYSRFTIQRSFKCDFNTAFKSEQAPRRVVSEKVSYGQSSNQGSNSRRNSSNSLNGLSANPGRRTDVVMPPSLMQVPASAATYATNSSQSPKLDRRRSFLKPSVPISEPYVEEKNAMPKFGIGEAFVPFVIFRKSDPDPSWALLPLLTTIPQCHQRLDLVCKFALDLLNERGILPFHVIHVEHCINCESHQLTTRHLPGQYDKMFSQLRDELKYKLPPGLIFSNLNGVSKCPPDVGSFEVAIRKYNSKHSNLVYSKVSKKVFPSPGEIVERLSDIILPEVINFVEECPNVEVFVLDAYSQRPLVQAEVTLLKLHCSITYPSEPLESIDDLRRLGIWTYRQKRLIRAASLDSPLSDSDDDVVPGKIERLPSLDENTESVVEERSRDRRRMVSSPSRTEKRALLSNDDKGSSTVNRKSVRKSSTVPEPVLLAAAAATSYKQEASKYRSTSPSDSIMRQSVGFSKIRAWSAGYVDTWFMEHGGSKESLNRAKVMGLDDGASLLRLLTAKNLESWGIKNRLHILKFIKGLAAICAGDNLELRERLNNCNVSMNFEQFLLSSQKQSRLLTSSPSLTGKYEVTPQYNGVQKTTDGIFEITALTAATTDHRGIVTIPIRTSGEYYLKITHPNSREFHSHVFRVSDSSTIVHSVSMKPQLALVMVVVRFSSITDVDSFPFFSFLTALLNTKSGKRHIIYCEYWTERLGEEFLFVGECWLPVGRYVCCVTGEMVNVEKPTREQNMDWRESLPAYYESFPIDKVVLSYRSVDAMRLHKNLLRRGFMVFQRFYAKIRQKRNFRGLMHIISAQLKIKKYLEYIRAKIRINKARKIQSKFRGHVKEVAYWKMKRGFIQLQAQARGVSVRLDDARKRMLSGAAFFVQILKSGRRSSIAAAQFQALNNGRRRGVAAPNTASVLEMIRTKRYLAAVLIQCSFRIYMSKIRFNKVLEVKKAKKVLLKFLHIIKERHSRLQVQQREKRRQAVEILFMSSEEKATKKLLRVEHDKLMMAKRAERLKMEAAIARLELQRRRENLMLQRKVIRVQALWRGHVCRSWVKDDKRKIIKIQQFLKTQVYRKRYEREKQRRLASRAKTVPQRQSGAIQAPVKAFKGFSNRLLTMINTHRRQKPTLDNIALGILTRPAIRIQSIWRMRRARKRYIAKRRAMTSRYPPLYRYLDPSKNIQPEPDDINDEASHISNITSDSEVARKKSLFGALKIRQEQFAALGKQAGSYVAEKALKLPQTLTHNLQDFLIKRKQAQELKKQLAQEEATRKIIAAVVKIQASYRGALVRQKMYVEHEVEALIKKHIHYVSNEPSPRQPSLSEVPTISQGKQVLVGDDGITEAKSDVLPDLDESFAEDPSNRSESEMRAWLSPPQKSGQADANAALALVTPTDDRDRIRPNITISIDTQPSLPDATPTSTLKCPEVTSTLMNNEPTPLAAATKSLGKAGAKLGAKLLDQAAHTTNAFVNATHKAVALTQDYLLRQKLAAELESRRKTGQLALTDAVLNIRGTLMTDFPLLDKKWYMKAYPKASYTQSGVEIDNVNESWRDVAPDRTTATLKSAPGQITALPATANHSILSPNASETTRTMTMYPFSVESFYDASFFIHLADLSRYKSIEICIYIENEAGTLLPNSSVDGSLARTGVDGIPVSDQAHESDEKSELRGSRFVPIYFGECFIGRGSIFGPSGGRMNLKLKPNSFELMRLPHGRQLQANNGINVLVSLMPACQPSTAFLRTFRAGHRQSPCYPSVLADCERFNSIDVQWDNFYGGAVCSASFGKRVLISTRRNGSPRGIAEFDTEGRHVGLAFNQTKDIGTVILMIAGYKHIACCGSTGYVSIIREDHDGEPTVLHGMKRFPWAEPVLVTAFDRTIITCGCALAHAGLDFFFIVDKANEVCVIVMDKGECYRCAINHSFLMSDIKAICAYAPFLYIATADGNIVVLNIQCVFDGEIEAIGFLHRYVVRMESLFPGSTGIVSMVVAAPNEFLGLKTEDEERRDMLHRKKLLLKPQSDSILNEYVEGHLLLVGGGENNPVVKVLQPLAGGMREIVTLTGHSRAVNHIAIDAAGRSIITGSSGERKMLIWDGLSFTCESLIEDVNIGSMTLAEDALVVTSQKAPFFRMWVAPPVSLKPRVADKYASESELKCRAIEQECCARYTDIAVVRTPNWCHAMLKGGFKPKKAVMVPPYLDPIYTQVLWRWTHQYIRQDAPESMVRRDAARLRGNELSPSTPMAIRRGETPRARARRRFEKAQLESASDLPNLPALIPDTDDQPIGFSPGMTAEHFRMTSLQEDEDEEHGNDESPVSPILPQMTKTASGGSRAQHENVIGKLKQFLDTGGMAGPVGGGGRRGKHDGRDSPEEGDEDEAEDEEEEEEENPRLHHRGSNRFVKLPDKLKLSSVVQKVPSPDTKRPKKQLPPISRDDSVGGKVAVRSDRQYRVQFGEDSSDDEEELTMDTQMRRAAFEEEEKKRVALERRQTIRPKQFKHLNDEDD